MAHTLHATTCRPAATPLSPTSVPYSRADAGHTPQQPPAGPHTPATTASATTQAPTCHTSNRLEPSHALICCSSACDSAGISYDLGSMHGAMHGAVAVGGHAVGGHGSRGWSWVVMGGHGSRG